jgi:hypothetical protein
MPELLEAPGEYQVPPARALPEPPGWLDRLVGVADRVCSRCGAIKPVEEFPIKVRASGLRRVWCRPCCRAYGREHYQRNRPAYLEKADRRRRVERPLVRERVFGYLRTHPCVDCGEAEIVLLDFDHRDPTLKRVTVSRLIRSASWEAAEREIAKCDVRCANCHRRRTAEQFGWARSLGVNIDPSEVRPGSSGRYAGLEVVRQDLLFSGDPHGLRRCSRCGELKALSDFPLRDIRAGAKGHYCRPCQAEYRRGHYVRNRPDYIRRAMDEARLKKEDQLLLLHDYLRSHPCVECGETDIVALDFDHIDPGEKELEISKMLGRRPWMSILAEIRKCAVRCANCHRRRTAEQQGWVKRLGEEPARYGRIRVNAGVAQLVERLVPNQKVSRVRDPSPAP